MLTKKILKKIKGPYVTLFDLYGHTSFDEKVLSL